MNTIIRRVFSWDCTRAILIVLGIFGAVALAAFIALLCLAAAAGIGPHFGWI
jgi:hypothetical protein